ncbi:hypothetical protein PM10SUCC1_25070 [Propionigenium maris DSM 9537]|uniref:Uncharacterized protein n=1 Tax=Propionigenium maris DSM 9537 TaxID=1123000 RepID=A0A9W6GKX0_9FUSO|nr:hypothetical protein [Propionigenium maris]GLI56993.1 hypothetical protein PM10SUCC1_25070 [Propionigenium maris DSM 9537]
MELLEIKSKTYSKGYTMKELYKKLGLSRQNFYNKIKKKDKKTIEKIKKILS